MTTHPVFHYQTPHTMTDILTEIIACKQIEIELQKAAISKEMLINNCNEPMPRISMRASLASSPYGIISEFKRRSPSKGWIKEDAQADTIPPTYEAAGASALSILTDEKYFGGSLKDIRSARPHVQLPILRKDFIIDEYQLYQARIVGADAILLIAAALKKEQCKALALKAHELELEVLLEIHNEQELEYIDENIDMVGVNNRNLGSFHTEVENSFRQTERVAILSPRSMVKFAPLKTCLEPNDIPASLISATICPERGAGGNLMLSVARSSSSTSIRSRRSSCLMRDCTWFDLVGL